MKESIDYKTALAVAHRIVAAVAGSVAGAGQAP